MSTWMRGSRSESPSLQHDAGADHSTGKNLWIPARRAASARTWQIPDDEPAQTPIGGQSAAAAAHHAREWISARPRRTRPNSSTSTGENMARIASRAGPYGDVQRGSSDSLDNGASQLALDPVLLDNRAADRLSLGSNQSSSTVASGVGPQSGISPGGDKGCASPTAVESVHRRPQPTRRPRARPGGASGRRGRHRSARPLLQGEHHARCHTTRC